MATLESRIAELERRMESVSAKVMGLTKALFSVISAVSEMRESGYSALQDPPAGARPPRDGGVPVSPSPQRFDEKVVPAIQELQQLYTDLVEYLQAENFEDRVAGLEEGLHEFQEWAGHENARAWANRDSRFEYLQQRVAVLEARLAGREEQVHAIKPRMDAIDHVVNEVWDKVEALQGREDEQAMNEEKFRILWEHVRKFETSLAATQRQIGHANAGVDTLMPMAGGMIDYRVKATEQLQQLLARVEAIDQVLGQFTVDPLELAQIRNSIEQLAIGLEQQALLNAHFANEIKAVGKALGGTQQQMIAFAEEIGRRMGGR